VPSVPLLTISQLASYAGVTVRAVRHYHARGLLPEPERDSSGYRRYEAQAVIDLIRIKTLADAGVPLSRVAELLRAEPEEFRAATAQIDRNLRAEIRRLQGHRARVAQLESAERLALPPRVAEWIERLRALGATERGLAMERDVWVLAAAQYPDEIDSWMDHKFAQLDDDPEFVHFILQFDQAYEWSPEDPRLVEVADEFADYLARYLAEHGDVTDAEPLDSTFVEMVDGMVLNSSPAWERLLQLIEERGWVGWTEIAPADPGA
jgi:DNA-binding transcriptional MerR regulator